MDRFLFIRISIEHVANPHVSDNLAEVTRIANLSKERTSINTKITDVQRLTMDKYLLCVR